MANRMILNETSYFGAGSISCIVDEIKARAFQKILVVTDPDLIRFQVSTKVTNLLEQAGIGRGKLLPDGCVLGRPVLLFGVGRSGKSGQCRLQLSVVVVEILHQNIILHPRSAR